MRLLALTPWLVIGSIAACSTDDVTERLTVFDAGSRRTLDARVSETIVDFPDAESSEEDAEEREYPDAVVRTRDASPGDASPGDASPRDARVPRDANELDAQAPIDAGDPDGGTPDSSIAADASEDAGITECYSGGGDTCLSCMELSCCPEMKACLNGFPCLGEFNCLGQCSLIAPISECMSQCFTSNEGVAFRSAVTMRCAAECP